MWFVKEIAATEAVWGPFKSVSDAVHFINVNGAHIFEHVGNNVSYEIYPEEVAVKQRG